MQLILAPLEGIVLHILTNILKSGLISNHAFVIIALPDRNSGGIADLINLDNS
jgi:hypothetical protein